MFKANYCSVFKFFVWVNIYIQVVFSSYVFMPFSLAYSKDQPANSYQLSDNPRMSTTIYRVSYGETAESVAKKFNIDVGTLRRLNQKTAFLKSFDHLQKGDMLLVPMALSIKESEGNARFSGYAQQIGTFLTNGGRSSDAQSTATNFLVGKANTSVEQWLNRYGTARFQLNIDHNFSLKNSQFEMLLPVWDDGKRLFFTQGSIHHTDSRTQANLGLGARYSAGDYMIGSNVFWDYDISRYHSRMGIGVEYWRDYLKLGANGYFRISSWRSSPDIEDYDERPANGWDVRAEGYLPFYPQAGLKLNYEQYYGNEVALFGKDNRRHNPYAVTFGASYTPFPLMTFNMDHRRGASGDNDTRFGAQLTYKFGVPLKRQLDPDAVNDIRTIAGNRYDLVNRNNNIILEYRRQEVIRLSMANYIAGLPGENHSLAASVEAKHGLAQVDWAAPALLAAGGSVIAGASLTDYKVVLPPYHVGGEENNTYFVTATATDKKGNVSKQATTQIVVKAPVIDNSKSTFLPVESTLTADDTSSVTLTLMIRDSQGRPADINVSHVDLSVSGKKSAKITDHKRTAAGTYELIVTAGTDEETVTFTPSVNGIVLPVARVIILPGAPFGDQSTFDASPSVIHADNSATSTLTFVAKDSYDNAVGGIADRLNFAVTDSSGAAPASGAVSLSSIRESSPKGTYTATLKGTLVDTYTVKPEYDSAPIGTLETQVELTADATTAVVAELKLQGNTVVKTANGTDSFDYVATIKDKNGNRVPDLTVAWFKNTENADFSKQTSTTDANGQAAVSLTSKNPEGAMNVQVAAKASAETKQVNADKIVNFIGYRFVLETAKEVIAVNGTSQYNVIAIPSDNSGKVVLTSEAKWSTSNASVATSVGDGLIRGKSAGTADIIATGTYKGIAYRVVKKLTVKAPVFSPIYGDQSGPLEEHIIRPPSYLLATRCGFIVDAVGTLEGITGGPGGDAKKINDMDKVSAITMYWGKYKYAPGGITIGKIDISYSDGRPVQSCGRNEDMTEIISQTYYIPADMVLQGVRVNAGQYVWALQWIAIGADVKVAVKD